MPWSRSLKDQPIHFLMEEERDILLAGPLARYCEENGKPYKIVFKGRGFELNDSMAAAMIFDLNTLADLDNIGWSGTCFFMEDHKRPQSYSSFKRYLSMVDIFFFANQLINKEMELVAAGGDSNRTLGGGIPSFDFLSQRQRDQSDDLVAWKPDGMTAGRIIDSCRYYMTTGGRIQL